MNKMFNTMFKGSISHSLVLLIGLLITVSVEASHFRFGHFTWEARPDISPETADFRMTVAFRSSAFGHPNIGQTFRPGSFNFGDGRSVRYNFEVIARNLQEDWIVGRAIESGQENGVVRHTYPAVNNNGDAWRAIFASCCKIGSLRNAANASWSVITLVNLEDGNSSPFSNLPPIVTCSKFNCRFRIPAVDPDGDRLTWRMATRAESAIRSIPAGMAVDNDTGIFTWDGSDTFTNGLYSVQVIIEDRDENDELKSNTALDFIINLQDQGSNDPPEFDIPPTPERGSVIQAIVGQPLVITVQATDPNPNDEVFLNHVGLPQGATFEQSVTGGVTGVATLEWTPVTDDIGQHIVTFLANDNRGGASLPVPITIDVIKPAISDVRVVSTISTADIEIDTSSYSLPPSLIAIEDNRTIVTWEFPTFNVGQLENLNTQLRLFNLEPGEQRVVTEKLELFYTDIDGQLVYELLDEQMVKVAPTLTRVSISTDKSVYFSGETVTVASAIENLSNIPADAIVELEIVDNQQNLVTSLGTVTETAITPQGTIQLPGELFETAGIYVGAYEAVAKLMEDGDVVQQASAPFAITTENGQLVNVGALVNTDKPVYQAWDQVIISLRALNLADTASFSGGEGQVQVRRPNGELLIEETYTLNSLAPQAIYDRQLALPLVDREAGTYQVQWIVSQDGTTLATSSADFEVERAELLSLLGDVSVIPYPTGEARSCSFETTNRSNTSPVTATLIYQVVNIDNGELVYEVREPDVDVTNTSGHPYELLLGDLPAYGGYGCILMAEINGELAQLAAAGFEVTPPELTLSALPASQGKLLVLVDNDAYSAPHDSNLPAAQRQYLEQLLTANRWSYTIVDNHDDFVSEFYSGIYGAIAIFSEGIVLNPEVEGLLVEAQHSGVGLLIGGGSNRRNSQLERDLGITLKGTNIAATAINVTDEYMANPVAQDALVPQGLVLAHCDAAVWATFMGGKNASDDCAYPDAPAAITTASYGNGDNAYFAYDILDLATSTQGLHEQLLLDALQHIQPQVWPSTAGRVIPIRLSVDNLSRKAAVDLRLRLPHGGSIIESSLPLQKINDAWLWQRDFAASAQAAIVLYIQLPTTVTGDIYLDIDVDAGINRSLMTDNQDLQALLAIIPTAPAYHRALDLMGELSANGSGVARYDFVTKRLNAAQSHINKGKLSNAIHSLLQAAAEIAKEPSEPAIAARLVIDEWLFELQQQLASTQ